MLRVVSILLLSIAGLSAAQYCPAVTECTGCELGWPHPEFTETYELVQDDVCTVTIHWDYPFVESENKTNPEMVFKCSYTDGEPCNQDEKSVCASCDSIEFNNLRLSESPHLVYSDTCGNVDTIIISESCKLRSTTTAQPATTNVQSDITVLLPATTTTKPVSISAQSDTTLKATTSGPDGDCKAAFDNIGGKCLLIDPFISANWNESRFFCGEIGGDLATIESDELYLDILNFIKDNSLENNDYWIGADNTLINDTYTWINGEHMELGTPYWAVYGLGNDEYGQEPMDAGFQNYNCVQMDSNRYLYYDDADCTVLKAAICQQKNGTEYI